MKRLATRWKAGLFGAAIVASLGFGAVQAFAAPQPPARRQACTAAECNLECGAPGGDYIHGRCICCG
ncbi:MAG: hypothetical protein JO306_01800 [Gemmatimonadetes bacterium]|nr:hypothetical protein [Gemmatimonadota bacterium]